MSSNDKLTLALELKNNLFSQKLRESQSALFSSADKMQSKLSELKEHHVNAFGAMGEASGSFGHLIQKLANPYALAAAGAAAFIGVLSKGVGLAAHFNNEFLEIKNLNMERNVAELDEYKDLIKKTAFTTGMDLSATSKGFYDIQSSLGYFGKDADALFKKLSAYSIATRSSLDDTINSTTKAMRAYGLSIKDVNTLLESNAKTVHSAHLSYKKFSEVQVEYIGAARAASQSIDTANKIFANFTLKSKNPDMAATLARSSFEGLTQDSVIKGLRGIDVSLYDKKGKMKDLMKVLEEVSSRFFDKQGKRIKSDRYAHDWVNSLKGNEGVRVLFSEAAMNPKSLQSISEAYNQSAFDLNHAFKNALKDTTTLYNLIKNKLSTAMAALGERVLPLIHTGLEKMNEALSWAADHWEDVSAALKMVGVALGGFLIFNNIIPLIISFTSLMLTNPLTLWIVGIGALIGGLIYLTTKFEGLASVWEWLCSLADIYFLMVKNNLDNMGLWFDTFCLRLKTLGEKIMDFSRMLAAAFKGNFAEAKKHFDQLIDISAYKKAAEINELNEKNTEIAYVKNKGKAWEASGIALENINVYNRNDANKLSQQSVDKAREASLKGFGIFDFKKFSDLNKEDAKMYGDPSKGSPSDRGFNFGKEDPVGKVTSGARGPKMITINIDSFVKGNINLSQALPQSALSDKDKAEEFFKEMFMRVVAGTEYSYS